MRGSSGARFTVEDSVVTKYDTEVTGSRVRNQGIWLRRYDESVLLPAVFTVRVDGYEMEKLKHSTDFVDGLPMSWGDVYSLCDDIIDALETQLWHLDFEDVVIEHVRFNDCGYHLDFDRNPNHHNRYVKNLLANVGLKSYVGTLRKFADRIKWYKLKTGLTHGDCIIDNVMWRSSRSATKQPDQLVLIDPIPACPALPDVTALDVGRVIQSAVGYEHARYLDSTAVFELNQTPLTKRVEGILNTWLEPFDINEARAALYLSVIHMLRGVRTAQRVAPSRVHALKNLTDRLVTEAERWMR